LLNVFINSPRLFQLADRLSFSQTQKIYLENLRGSSPEFFTAAIFEHPSCSQFNHLIVLNDAEDAAYFHNTLENLTGALDIFYFLLRLNNEKTSACLTTAT
jgi:transcription-repair coupling factor (superfamily II helicase)